jgi:hypothetical protein
MKDSSHLGRLEVFIGSAAIAAHATFAEHGFRQRDVRFFVDLFLNWAEDVGAVAPKVQNTQLLRFLGGLVDEGYAKRSNHNEIPVYRLTRVGLLELLTRITTPADRAPPAHFLFMVLFIRGYRGRLEKLIADQGQLFPVALKLEVQALLEIDDLLKKEIKKIERAIGRLEQRISDAEKTSQLTKNRLASGVPFAEIVKEAEKRFPYELNSMKPLSELISDIAPDQRRWELETGNVLRAQTLWVPQRAMLIEYLKQLRRLLEQSPARA